MVRRGREVNKVVSFGLGLWLPCLTSKICPWPSPPRTLIIVFVSELGKSVNPAFLVNEMQAPSTGGWRPPRHSIYLERGRGWSDQEFICGVQHRLCHHSQSPEYLYTAHIAAVEQGTVCLPREDRFIHFRGIIISNSWSLPLSVSLLTHFCFVSHKSHG